MILVHVERMCLGTAELQVTIMFKRFYDDFTWVTDEL